MSHWNYRIVRFGKEDFGIAEVYYNKDGTPAYCSEPIELANESRAGLAEMMSMIINDLVRQPKIVRANLLVDKTDYNKEIELHSEIPATSLSELIQERLGDKYTLISITTAGNDPTFDVHTYVARSIEDPDIVITNRFVTFKPIKEY